MDASIAALMKPFLTAAEIEASYECMGLDTQLIDDGVYFVVEEAGAIIGCGGWSRRATLFGGDHTVGRDARFLDPDNDAARVRAMYTDPAHARRGVGRAVLVVCENAARAEGFRRAELAATLAGVPLYSACGYTAVKNFFVESSKGVKVPLVLMEKDISAQGIGPR